MTAALNPAPDLSFEELVEALSGLAIAAFAYFFVRPRKRLDGQVFCIAAGLYAIFRFTLEFLRRDERGGLLGLSTSQLIALGFLAFLAYFWRRLKRRKESLLPSA